MAVCLVAELLRIATVTGNEVRLLQKKSLAQPYDGASQGLSYSCTFRVMHSSRQESISI